MVVAVALLALVALAALIPAAQAPSSEQSSAASTDSQSGAGAAPVSEPAAPQMSEEEAIDAYGKPPLSCFFSHKGAMLSFAEGKRRGHALALNFLRSDPDATLTAQKRLSGKVNYLVGDDPAEWQQGLATHAELLYGGLWPGIDMTVRGEGATSSTSSA